MGMSENLFHGPYRRVWLPDEEYENSMRVCSNEGCINHKKNLDSKCCPECGSVVEDIKYKNTCQVNLDEFLEEELGDCDLFVEVEPRDTDYVLVVPNMVSRQGGQHFEDDPKTEIVSYSREGSFTDSYLRWFEKEDWQRLIKVLAEKSIKHECMVGVLKWVS